MSKLEAFYPGQSVGAVADQPFGMVFIDYVLARIEAGHPEDLVHAPEITKILSSGGQELEQQWRRLSRIQEEVAPNANTDQPIWLWMLLNPTT